MKFAMKGFFKFVVFVAVVGAAIYFGRPYVEKFLEDRAAAKKEAAEAAKKAEAAPATAVAPVTVPAARAKAPPPDSKAVSPEIEQAVRDLYPMPEIPPLADLVGNWTNIPERAFPRDLVIAEPVEFGLMRDGKVIGTRSVPAGSAVVAKAFLEGKLTISPAGSELMSARVGVEATNLRESMQESYDAFVGKARARVLSLREEETRRLIRNEKQERILMTGWTDGNDEVFAPMKASLANGGVEDYVLEDAQRWRWLGEEVIGGVTYEVGKVQLFSETIFGIFPTEVKALIRNGVVEKWVDEQWVDPDTGEGFK